MLKLTEVQDNKAKEGMMSVEKFNQMLKPQLSELQHMLEDKIDEIKDEGEKMQKKNKGKFKNARETEMAL